MQDEDPSEIQATERGPRDHARGAPGSSAYLKHAGAGLQFALTFLGLGLVGWWLDRRLGTSPWLLIVGIAVGAAGGMYSLVVRVGAVSNSKSKPSSQSKP